MLHSSPSPADQCLGDPFAGGRKSCCAEWDTALTDWVGQGEQSVHIRVGDGRGVEMLAALGFGIIGTIILVIIVIAVIMWFVRRA
jgi:hypothetical protein